MKIISRIRDFLYVIVDYAFVLVVGAGLAAICWFSYKNLIGYAERGVPQDTFAGVSEESSQAALTMKVTIPEATTPEQFSALLQEYGVFSESGAEDFSKYLKEHFSEPTVPSGEYYFHVGQDFSEILDTLTNSVAAPSEPAASDNESASTTNESGLPESSAESSEN